MRMKGIRTIVTAGLALLILPGLSLAKGSPRINALEARIEALEEAMKDLEATLAALEASISVVTTKLEHFSRTGDEVVIEGANLHVRNGSGSTDTTNGLGNVIIGYNENGGPAPDRSGSHNLVMGEANGYSSYAGIASGQANTISAPYACAISGANNVVSGDFAVTFGGWINTASGAYSVVSGGADGIASGLHDWVAGSLFEDN